MKKQHVGGFTLTELMFVLAIVGIGFAIGAPSFSGLVKRNRISASVNEIITGFQLARSEAAKRGVSVTICPTNSKADDPDNTVDCENNGSWDKGVIVFVDENASGGRDELDDVLLMFRGKMPKDIFVRASNDMGNGVTYGGDGFPAALLNTSQMVFCDETGDQTRRAVVSMSATGRPATARSMAVPGDMEC